MIVLGCSSTNLPIYLLVYPAAALSKIKVNFSFISGINSKYIAYLPLCVFSFIALYPVGGVPPSQRPILARAFILSLTL